MYLDISTGGGGRSKNLGGTTNMYIVYFFIPARGALAPLVPLLPAPLLT